MNTKRQTPPAVGTQPSDAGQRRQSLRCKKVHRLQRPWQGRSNRVIAKACANRCKRHKPVFVTPLIDRRTIRCERQKLEALNPRLRPVDKPALRAWVSRNKRAAFGQSNVCNTLAFNRIELVNPRFTLDDLDKNVRF